MGQDISLGYFENVAQRTVDQFPARLRDAAIKVALIVVDWPTVETLRRLGIADARDLTGLYEGIPLTEKSVWDVPMAPDTIWLFRQCILSEWRERGNIGLETLITHVTVHEFAHHFGWSDADIARIDRWWE